MTAATYIVQPGDSLSMISKKFYGDFSQVDALASANNIQNKNLISVGQQLIIPGIEEAQVVETTSSGSGAGKWVLGLLLLGGIGYLGYKHYKKKKADKVFNGHFSRTRRRKKKK